MTGITKLGRAVGIAAIALMTMAGFGGARAADPPKVSIEFDWSPHGMHAWAYLAKQKGWYDQAGLNVELLDGKGSSASIQQLAAGQIDVSFAQLGAMAAAISNGLPIISVMGFVRAGDNGLMVPADSGWKTLKDLKGKKIAVPAGSATAAFLDAFLKAGGVSRSDFTIVNVDNSAMVSTYTSGGADAALSTVAYFAPIVESVRPSTGILFSDVGLNVPGYGLIVRKDELTAKADTLKKLMAVNQKVWDYIFAGHEEEAVDALLKLREGERLDRKVLLGQLKAYMPLFFTAATKGKPLGWQAESDWADTVKVMKEVGMVKPSFQTSDFYTNQFIPGN